MGLLLKNLCLEKQILQVLTPIYNRGKNQSIGVTLKCLSIETPKTFNFPFVPNGKLVVLGVPIFEHIIIRL